MLTVSEALAQAATQDPELESFYEFHRALFQVQEQARLEITATLEMLDRETLQRRALRGRPLLTLAHLPIQTEQFARLGTALAQALVSYYPDLKDRTLPDTPEQWRELAEERFTRNQAEQSAEPSPLTLAEMATDLALRPYLAWAAEQLWPHVDEKIWKRSYCPVCGGAPDLALLEAETGARRLACPQCNTQWPYPRLGCPFCDIDDYKKIIHYSSNDGVYRLYVCKVCRRYLKTIDLRKTRRPVLLPVERVTTVALDVAAQENGFH
jgi:FdhE protein